MGKKVLAVRSAAIIVFTVLLWAITLLLTVAICFIMPYILSDLKQYLVLIVSYPLIVIFSFIYTKWLIDIPKVIVYYNEGKIYFCPKKNIIKSVRPDEIIFISQRHYHARHYRYSFGILIVQLAEQSIKLRWIRDVEEARRLIEKLKAKAEKSLYQNN